LTAEKPPTRDTSMLDREVAVIAGGKLGVFALK
jgi:hypothetical protein